MESEDNKVKTKECRRCGECCRRGGPALHSGDLELLEDGILAPTDLVRIRKDEPVFDQIKGRVIPAAAEMLKLAGRNGSWCCRFFRADPPACSIHARRPLECRLLFCRAPEAVAAVAGRDLLPLALLPGIAPELLGLAAEFDRVFPFKDFNRTLAEAAAGRSALADLDSLLNRELAFRLRACREHHLPPAMEAAVLGRPFFLSAAAHGFSVQETGNSVSVFLS